jgi:TPP-dependent pyruvate/acetoin dehydrogenase alpha subunit
MGLQSALDKEDDIIGTYRCHGLQFVRGCAVSSIVAELYGFGEGSSKGKGGSMHFYSKKNHFWGGGGALVYACVDTLYVLCCACS